jgi:hypothetical protein
MAKKGKIGALFLITLLFFSIFGAFIPIIPVKSSPSLPIYPIWTLPETFPTVEQARITKKYVILFNNTRYFNDVSPDEKYLSVAPRTKAYIFDLATGENLANVTGEGVFLLENLALTKVLDVSGKFSANGKRLYCIDYQGYESSWVGSRNYTIDLKTMQHYTVDVSPYIGKIYTGASFALGVMDYSCDNFIIIYYGGYTETYFYFIHYKLNYTTGKYDAKESFDGDWWSGVSIAQWHTVSPDFSVFIRYSVYSNNVTFYKRVNNQWIKTVSSGFRNVNFIHIDPVGFKIIAVGRSDGILTIGRYDKATDTFITYLNVTYTPSDFGYSSGSLSWSYPPQYTVWWMPIGEPKTLAFIGRVSIGGYNYYPAVVYDVQTNEIVKVTNDAKGPAVSVSPLDGNFVFLGRTLYGIRRITPQSGNPRVRFSGETLFENYLYDLKTPLTFSAPLQDGHAYFSGGKVTISSLYTSVYRANLVTDEDILYGNLAKMYQRGLVSYENVKKEYADILESGVYAGSDLISIFDEIGVPSSDYEHYTIELNRLKFSPPPYIAEGVFIEAGKIKVPLDTSVSMYGNITFTGGIMFDVTTIGYDKTKRALAVFGIPEIVLGAGVAGGAVGAWKYQAMLKAMEKWTVDEFTKGIVKECTEAAASTSLKTAGKVAAAVGIALLIWQGVDAALVQWGGFGEVEPITYAMACPVIEDDVGNRYTAIKLILPLEEAPRITDYYNLLSDYLKTKGFKDVGVSATFIGNTKKELTERLKGGLNIQVDLKSLVAETIVPRNNLDMGKLKIKGVELYLLTEIKAKQGFWEWLSGLLGLGGGVEFVVGSMIGSHSLMVTGSMEATTITDPSKIASILEKVKVNSVLYNLSVSSEGAYADFTFPFEVEKVKIEFPRASEGMFGSLKVNLGVVVKKDFSRIDNYGYIVDFHYNWQNTLIKLTKIEFADMEHPMLYAERTFIYAYGNFTHDITSAFILSSIVPNSSSPSGYLYAYTTFDTLYLDPANGGILQPCKRFIIRYYYNRPPDVALNVYLNGTEVTSTKARHATVVLNSTVEQDVSYEVYFRVKRIVSLGEETILEEHTADTLHVKNITYNTYLIEKYVDYAIKTMAEENKTAFVEIYARITRAEQNYLKNNDEAKVIYYPPPLIVQKYGKPANLSVYVYDAINGSSIADAIVKVINSSNPSIYYEKTTNSTGWAVFNITAALWNITASKSGYYDYSTQLMVFKNMTFNIPLVPKSVGGENVTIIIYPPTNQTEKPIIIGTKEYWWLSVQVVWKDGFPFENALVTVRNTTNNAIIFQKRTNGTGFVYTLIPNGSTIKVEVNATNPLNPSQTFYDYRIITMNKHMWVVFKVGWVSEYYAPEVMLVYLEVVIHRGQGYLWGNVSHLVMIGIWTNKPQNVSLLVELINSNTSQVINSKTVNFTLSEGYNSEMVWIPINASQGMYVKAHAKILYYQYDTDLNNNELYSKTVFLKPFLDLQLFVYYRFVQTKLPWALLPEDIIQIDIGVKTPIALSKPFLLVYGINSFDIRSKTLKLYSGGSESISVPSSGMIWRNFTVVIPWTSKIFINASVSHEWEDFLPNNYANITLSIDPDVKISIVKKLFSGIITEGQTIKISVNVTSNIEAGKAKGWLSAFDNTTEKLLYRKEIGLEPSRIYDIDFKAPENPIMFWILRSPTSLHNVESRFAGYDMYLDNNADYIKITVVSNQWLWILLAIVILIIIIMTIFIAGTRVARHTIEEYREERRKFVKRKSSSLNLSTIENPRRFVKRKKE